MRGESLVQRAKERTPATGEMLPGVLAVQDDRDQRVSPAGPLRITPPGLHQPAEEVVGRGIGGPARICKPDQIPQHVITEPARPRPAPGAADVQGVEMFWP